MTELAKQRDSYAPADDVNSDVFAMESASTEGSVMEETDENQRKQDSQLEKDNSQRAPTERPLSPLASLKSSDLCENLPDLANDEFLIAGPPSVQSIRVESPANSMINGKSGNQDASITMLERPVPPSFALPKNAASDDPGNVAQRIMGKDISSCFEPIEKLNMNFESDSEEDIDISSTKDHSDGESTIPYAEDSDVDIAFDDQETQSSNANDENVYDFDKEAKLMSPPAGKKSQKEFCTG